MHEEPERDYHACTPLRMGMCQQSRKGVYDHPDTGAPCCDYCYGLVDFPWPGAMPACTACGSQWARDPITGMAFCAHCEAVAGVRARKAIEKRTAHKKADVAFEAQYRQLVLSAAREEA